MDVSSRAWGLEFGVEGLGFRRFRRFRAFLVGFGSEGGGKSMLHPLAQKKGPLLHCSRMICTPAFLSFEFRGASGSRVLGGLGVKGLCFRV